MSVLATEAESSFPAIVAEDSVGIAASDEFPGFVIRDRIGLLAAAGCLPEPDGTLSITVPIVRPGLQHQQLAHSLELLFRHVRRHAQERQKHAVHCLVDPEASARQKSATGQASHDLLAAGGLRRIADLRRVKKFVVPIDSESRPGIPEHIVLPGGQALNVSIGRAIANNHCGGAPAGRVPLSEFVGRVLQESDDLPGFIRPSAEQLLTSWEQRQADLLMVLQQDASPQSAHSKYVAIAATTWSPDDCCLMIEYLGVCPQFRRSGIGRHLLQSLDILAGDLLRQVHAADRSCAEVAAFVDAANSAATTLYEAAGYVDDGDFQLWHMSIDASPAEQT